MYVCMKEFYKKPINDEIKRIEIQCTNVADTQPPSPTLHDSKSTLYSITRLQSRGKNDNYKSAPELN